MSEPRWYLHFAWGRAPYALDLPEVVIGRGEGCPLQIEEPAAGEEHARIVIDDNELVWLEDLGSGVPTLQNGRTVRGKVRLVEGDFVQIGHSVLTLRAGGASRRAPVSAAPDARTMAASELPEEVKQALAARDAGAAKNFVVGTHEVAPLATLMMESPLFVPEVGRSPQRTVEVNVEEMMAAIRKNVEAAPAALAPPTLAPARPTSTGSRGSQQMATMMGIGPQDLAAAPTMIGEAPAPLARAAIASESGVVPRGLHSEDSAPTRIGAEPGEPARSGGSPSVEVTDLLAAPTMIAGALTSDPPPRSSLSSNPDITPLPAPLPPPTASISDLGPLIAAATAQSQALRQGFAGPEAGEQTAAQKKLSARAPDPVLSAAATQQLAAVQDRQPPLAERRTMAPNASPLHQRQTMPPMAAASAPPRDSTGSRPAEVAYLPPQKGAFGSFSRAIDFFQQMIALGKRERGLVRPIMLDLMIATPLSLAISALLLFVHSAGAVYGLLALGTMALYFVDYYCNAMTASLMYDHVTTGRADLATAKRRVKKSLGGIMTFAAVSAFLDVASTYARERNDLLSKILLRVLYAIWTTATYVIMPAMIIEGVAFKDALTRSKKLMRHDPTGVGAGVVALSLCSYILGAILFSLAFFLMRVGSHVHPVLGVALFFTVVNLYWAVSGWMKIAYSTCFYLWALRCEAEGRTDAALAPLPLRHAIDAG